MFYRNRGGPIFYNTGCSTFGCLAVFFIFSFLVGGGLVLFFRYFWLILLLGIIVWLFRKFTGQNENSSSRPTGNHQQRRQNWHRDFENKKETSYDNINREFEEIDDEEDNDFNDF